MKMCCRQGGRSEHEVSPMANTDLGVTYTEVTFDVINVSEITGSEDKAEIVEGILKRVHAPSSLLVPCMYFWFKIIFSMAKLLQRLRKECVTSKSI